MPGNNQILQVIIPTSIYIKILNYKEELLAGKIRLSHPLQNALTRLKNYKNEGDAVDLTFISNLTDVQFIELLLESKQSFAAAERGAGQRYGYSDTEKEIFTEIFLSAKTQFLMDGNNQVKPESEFQPHYGYSIYTYGPLVAKEALDSPDYKKTHPHGNFKPNIYLGIVHERILWAMLQANKLGSIENAKILLRIPLIGGGEFCDREIEKQKLIVDGTMKAIGQLNSGGFSNIGAIDFVCCVNIDNQEKLDEYIDQQHYDLLDGKIRILKDYKEPPQFTFPQKFASDLWRKECGILVSVTPSDQYASPGGDGWHLSGYTADGANGTQTDIIPRLLREDLRIMEKRDGEKHSYYYVVASSNAPEFIDRNSIPSNLRWENRRTGKMIYADNTTVHILGENGNFINLDYDHKTLPKPKAQSFPLGVKIIIGVLALLAVLAAGAAALTATFFSFGIAAAPIAGTILFGISAFSTFMGTKTKFYLNWKSNCRDWERNITKNLATIPVDGDRDGGTQQLASRPTTYSRMLNEEFALSGPSDAPEKGKGIELAERTPLSPKTTAYPKPKIATSKIATI